MAQLIPLPARDPAQPHRAATQLEIFFDLVFVVAIASVTASLHHAISEGHGAEGLPRFLFLFAGIWWAWMNFTWFASAFDNDGPLYRLLAMTIMLGALIFAGGAEHIFKTLDMQWGLLGWCIMRVAMALLWMRASSNPEYRKTCRSYAFGILIAQAGWILLYFVCEPGSTAFFVGGALVYLIEFAVPPMSERHGITPFHRHHIIERYGLLTMISMGEIMLAISIGFSMMYGEEGIMLPGIIAVGAAVIVFSLFWLYFAEEEHLPNSSFGTALGLFPCVHLRLDRGAWRRHRGRTGPGQSPQRDDARRSGLVAGRAVGGVLCRALGGARPAFQPRAAQPCAAGDGGRGADRRVARSADLGLCHHRRGHRAVAGADARTRTRRGPAPLTCDLSAATRMAAEFPLRRVSLPL